MSGNSDDATAFQSHRLLDAIERPIPERFNWREGLRNVVLLTLLTLALSTTLQALFGQTFLTLALALAAAYAVLVGGILAGLLATVSVFAFLVVVHFAPHWVPSLNDASLLASVVDMLAAIVVLLVAIGFELRRQLALHAVLSRSRVEQQAQLMQQILDNLGQPMFVALLDVDGVILEVNRRVLQASDVGRDELLGQRFSDAYWWDTPDLRETVRSAVGQSMQGQSTRFDIQARIGPEERIWVDFCIEPLVATDGRVRLLVASGTVVDERKHAEHQLSGVIEAVPTALIMVDRQGVIRLVNGNVFNLFGYRREELLGETLDRLLPPETREKHRSHMEGYFANPRPRMMGAGRELFGVHADGRHIPIEIGLSPIVDQDEVFVLAAISDISERIADRRELEDLAANLDAKVRQRTQELQISNDRWQRRNRKLVTVNEMSGLLAACRDEQELCRLVAGYQQRLFPQSSGGVYLDDGEFLQPGAYWGEEDRLRDSLTHSDCWALRRGKMHLATKSDTRLACNHVGDMLSDYIFTICIPLSAGDRVLGLLHIRIPAGDVDTGEMQEDATLLLGGIAEHVGLALSNQRMRAALQDQAIRDPLTGLYNRRYLDSVAMRMLAHAQRSGEPLAVVVADIDRFKNINDTYGHEVGDLVLKRVAFVMGQELRDADLLCRQGGEEFVVMLPNADIARARDVAERIRGAIEAATMPERVSLTISLGATTYAEGDDNVEDVIARADKAMYQAKQEGRNRVCVADLQAVGD